MFTSVSSPQYWEGKKLKPKPNYNSVDLSEVEWEDQAGTVSGSRCWGQGQLGWIGCPGRRR